MCRLSRFFIGILVSVGFQLAACEAQTGDDRGNSVSLKENVFSDIRITPFGISEQMAEPLSPAGRVIMNGPFELGSRPREYSFTELLLNENAHPLTNGYRLETAIPLALALHDIRLLQLLLEKGGDSNATVIQPVPPGFVRLFDNEYISRVFAKDFRVTALMLAVLSGQTEAVRLLLLYGANTQIHTPVSHMYPLDFAAELKSIPMMQLLLGKEPTREGQGHRIVISLSKQKGWFFHDGSVLLETPVSTGRAGYPTRPGEYVVTQKYTAWKSTLYKVPMPNFMRLNCGPTGLHGGVVPGVPASHGCIRLPKEMAAAFYSITQPGDRVSVIE